MEFIEINIAYWKSKKSPFIFLNLFYLNKKFFPSLYIFNWLFCFAFIRENVLLIDSFWLLSLSFKSREQLFVRSLFDKFTLTGKERMKIKVDNSFNRFANMMWIFSIYHRNQLRNLMFHIIHSIQLLPIYYPMG
jgi:hypothetical protein